jgi:hypothetical protein
MPTCVPGKPATEGWPQRILKRYSHGRRRTAMDDAATASAAAVGAEPDRKGLCARHTGCGHVRICGFRSRMTRAVFTMAAAVTGSVVRSTQPTQSPRPSATISTPPAWGRRTSRPRTWRRTAMSALSERVKPSVPSRATMRVLSASCVDGLLEEGVELGVRGEHWPAGRPGVLVHRLGAGEEVLDVE